MYIVEKSDNPHSKRPWVLYVTHGIVGRTFLAAYADEQKARVTADIYNSYN